MWNRSNREGERRNAVLAQNEATTGEPWAWIRNVEPVRVRSMRPEARSVEDHAYAELAQNEPTPGVTRRDDTQVVGSDAIHPPPLLSARLAGASAARPERLDRFCK